MSDAEQRCGISLRKGGDRAPDTRERIVVEFEPKHGSKRRHVFIPTTASGHAYERVEQELREDCVWDTVGRERVESVNIEVDGDE